MARARWRRLGVGAALLAALSSLSLASIAGGPGRLADYVASLGGRVLGLSMLFLLLADAVRAVRLMVMARLEGSRVGFSSAMVSRLVGRFFGILTPAYTGATPARAATLAALESMEPGRAFALAALESVYDSFVPVAFTVVLTLPLLPSTILPLLVSLFILVMWIGGLGWARTKSFARIVSRAVKSERLRCYILEQRELFFRVLSRGARPPNAAPALALTIASHAIETLSVLVIVHGGLEGVSSSGVHALVLSFLALEVTHVMIMAPTPGGAILFEYGLAGFLPAEAVVHWRIVYVLYSLLPGGILLILAGRLREYAARLEEVEPGGCGGEHLRHALPPTRVR